MFCVQVDRIASPRRRTTNRPWKGRDYVTWHVLIFGFPISQEWLKLELSNFLHRESISSLAKGMTNSERTSPVRNKIGCHGNVPWSLEILKKISDLSSTPKTLPYGIKIAKIARGLHFSYDTKLVAMATSLEESEKLELIKKNHANTFHLVKRWWKSVQ